MILSTSQKIFVIIALVFLLGFVAYGTITSDSEVTDGTATEVTAGTINGSDILALVEKFNNVSIDKAIFKSSLFNSLTDFSTALTPESQGRPNPFAPIGFDNFSTTATPASTPAPTAQATSTNR